MLGFGVVSSIVGAILGIVANGAGVPISYLAGTPFDSYAIPGLVLGVVVGGTQLAGAVGILARARSGLVLSAIAGFGMIIWIFVELAVIEEYSWLQTLYFTLGVAELAAVIALSGIVPRIVTPWKAAR
jgi:hypothetical protein